LIQKLIELKDFASGAGPESARAKNIIRKRVVDDLHRYHGAKTQARLLSDHRIKDIVKTLVLNGNLPQAQRLLSALVFHRVSEKKGPLYAIRRLFSEAPKTLNERNVKQFVDDLVADSVFMENIKTGLASGLNKTSLSRWISLVDRSSKQSLLALGRPETAEAPPLTHKYGRCFATSGCTQIGAR